MRGHLPVRGGQGLAVARGAIAGASALLSSFDASSAVTLSSRDWTAAALLPDAAVCQVRYLSVRGQSEGQLSCCDVRAVSHLSVVQDLRDVAGDRSFKHVFLGVVVTIWYRWSIALSQRALTGPSWHSGRSEM